MADDVRKFVTKLVEGYRFDIPGVPDFVIRKAVWSAYLNLQGDLND